MARRAAASSKSFGKKQENAKMRVIKTALREVYGLFVEDGSYALAVILWVSAPSLYCRFYQIRAGARPYYLRD